MPSDLIQITHTHTHTHRCWWLAIDTTTTSTDAKLIGAIDIPHRYTEVALMQWNIFPGKIEEKATTYLTVRKTV